MSIGNTIKKFANKICEIYFGHLEILIRLTATLISSFTRLYLTSYFIARNIMIMCMVLFINYFPLSDIYSSNGTILLFLMQLKS